MTVRKTESRVPGGFENAEALGQVNANFLETRPYVLVSYLTSPLRIGPGKNFINNRYIVLAAEDDGAGLNWSFKWVIELEKKSSSSESFSVDTETGWYDFTYSEDFSNVTESLTSESEPDLQKIRVRVELSNGVNLTLEQDVTILLANIEELIGGDQNESVMHANVGDRDITRLVANDYGQYLQQVDTLNIFDVPINFTAAIVYLNLLRLDARRQFTPIPLIEDKLNNGGITGLTDEGDLEPVGLCSLKSHFLAMLPISVTNPGEGVSYPLIDKEICLRLKDSFSGNNEFDYFNTYAINVSDDIKIDLYNFLRFPKSSIYYCSFLLHEYKLGNSDWKEIIKGNLFGEEEVVTSLISQLHYGPVEPVIKTDLAKKSFNIGYSQYIQEIIKNTFIPFQIIKVKVLDIRSGRPIRNAKVKKVVINTDPPASSATIRLEENFPYTSNYNKTDSLVVKSLNALADFGYDAGASANTYDANAISGYETYWNSRIIDNSVQTVTSGNPPDDMLRLIVEEYESHRETDGNGVLNIRLPHILLHGRNVDVEIGFWEFPVILEDINTTPNSSSIDREFVFRESNEEVDTDFTISWLGEAQDLDWENNIALTSHFGWGVNDGTKEGVLRTALKLTIKDDFNDFESLNKDLLSKHFVENDYNYHFVVFGMQWCQPLWQPLGSTVTHRIKGMVESDTGCAQGTQESIQDAERTFPHLCTRWNTGGVTNRTNSIQSGGGRDYGILVLANNNDILNADLAHPNLITTNNYRPNQGPRVVVGNRPHKGIDYYAISGRTKVFAPIGGSVRRSYHSGSLWGNTVMVVHKDFMFTHAHLSSRQVSAGDQVLSGQIIGVAGRTDAAQYPDEAPTHLHLEIAGDVGPGAMLGDRRIADPKDIVEKITPVHDTISQRNLFLTNTDYRIFPCDTEGAIGNWSANGCLIKGGAGNPDISRYCWAVRNLHCPYLAVNTNVVFKIQAQLEYLSTTDANFQNTYENNAYINNGDLEPIDFSLVYLPRTNPPATPGLISGGWDAGSEQAIQRFRERHREYIFQGMVSSPLEASMHMNPADFVPGYDGYEELHVRTLDRLNLVAPYPRTPNSLLRVET